MVTASWTRISSLWCRNNRRLSSLFRIKHDLSKPGISPKSAFSNSGRQLAAKKTQPLPKFPQATPKTKKTTAPLNAATYKPFAVALAQRASSILLYQASSQKVYMIGCYGIAVICFAWSSYYFFWLRHYPPKGFSVILIFCLNLSYAMVAGLGLFFLMRVS